MALPQSIDLFEAYFRRADLDHDGRISGTEALVLFQGANLPNQLLAQVLKQVWDLSNQDKDNMLSRREFYITLYLMERHREGCPLPSVLPTGIQIDETLKSGAKVKTAPQHSVVMGGMPWKHIPVMVSRPGIHVVVPGNMPGQFQTPRSDGVNTKQLVQQKSRVLVLEMNFVNQLSRDE